MKKYRGIIFFMHIIWFVGSGNIVAQEKRCNLSGIVSDEFGPLPGVAVMLFPGESTALTNQNGVYTFNNLPQGTYFIEINAPKYQAQNIEIALNQGTFRKDISLQSLETLLKDVSVTAKRHNADNFINLVSSAMPVMVIERKAIEQMGSRRLDEVLKEQTGLTVINDIASGPRAVGLQMQGFDSGYTMIMIDGQPITGRNSGNLDLSRITVSNIERIEIVKGAASCLFGSEALAGVVNIITRQTVAQRQGYAALKYGSFNMLDATLEGETPFAGKKGSAYLSGNYYSTDGFNANPYLQNGKTAPPFDSYSLQGRSRYNINKNNFISVNGRYTFRKSVNKLSYGVAPTSDVLNEQDINASVAHTNLINNSFRVKTQYYYTRYNTENQIADLTRNVIISDSRFVQQLHRAEIQAAKDFGSVLNLTSGMGGAYEILDNTAYRGNKSMANYFAYSQADWTVSTNTGVTAGARLDLHDRYGVGFNPSVGIKHTPHQLITLKASVGTGFKTPSFKELYQVFTNLQAGGYTVLGSEEFHTEIAKMQESGQISSVFPIASRIGTLKPERSVSYSAGFSLIPLKPLKIEVNGFFNDIRNFINSEQVGIKKSGQYIFSYLNVEKARLCGIETGVNWTVSKSFSVAAGYQLLYAKDRGIIDSIKNGTGKYAQVFDTDLLQARRSAVSDYFGMANRSRHSANIKFIYDYEPLGITATFRVNYRGKYGFMEANRENKFLDHYDTFVNGFFLLNASLQKTLVQNKLKAQFIADNMMDYKDMMIPGQPGRAVMLGLSWNFIQKPTSIEDKLHEQFKK